VETYKVTLLPGDGIGPEQTEATLKVLKAVQERFDFRLETVVVEAGDACLERKGVALPTETVRTMKASHACLKGPVGETAADVIVKLRLMFDLYANVRPVRAYPNVPCLSPDIDFVIIRENTEDLYKGMEFMADRETAIGLRVITKKGSERIARYAFEVARRRIKGRKVTAVHKANVLKLTCGLFAQTSREVAREYPDVTFEELYVDVAAMQLIKRPQTFDVVLTPNMFGDILSDEAAQLVGGLGMAPGANIGENYALFEPVHGSAPKYAGKQYANPCSMILASKMMLDWLGVKHGNSTCVEAAQAVEKAVTQALSKGHLTRDLGGSLKTREMGEAIAREILI